MFHGGPLTDALKRRYPAAWESYVSPDASGHARRIMEAVSESVVFASAGHSLGADYIACMRPLRPKREAAMAIERAFDCAGRRYDFDFHTDAALVCSELV